VVKEVLDYGRCTLGYWRTVILHDSVERLHGLQGMVRRAPFQQFDHRTANTPVWRQILDEGLDLFPKPKSPDVRCGGGATLLNNLRCHWTHVRQAVLIRGLRWTSLLQYGLPTTASSLAAPAVVVLLATPKSASLTAPSLVVRMLAPLMSRWITP
jgi:hypothetical protein